MQALLVSVPAGAENFNKVQVVCCLGGPCHRESFPNAYVTICPCRVGEMCSSSPFLKNFRTFFKTCLQNVDLHHIRNTIPGFATGQEVRPGAGGDAPPPHIAHIPTIFHPIKKYTPPFFLGALPRIGHIPITPPPHIPIATSPHHHPISSLPQHVSTTP